MKLFSFKSKQYNTQQTAQREAVNIPSDEFEKLELKIKLLGDYLKWFNEDYYKTPSVNIKKMVYQRAEQREKIESFIMLIEQLNYELEQKKTASHDQAKAD